MSALMPASLIDIRSLNIIPGGGKGAFSHVVKKGTLPGSTNVYFSKEMKEPRVARLEILAQEFFRLIIPSQPETRIASNPHLNTYYILSEEVSGYKNLPLNSHNQFINGLYPNLGRVMLLSVFLQEIDLKNGNICLNADNHVVKIDGDWCFAAIRDSSFAHYKKDISPDLLKTLPFTVGYAAFNWLDIWKEGIAYSSSKVVNEHLANAPHFRNEINEAILKILLLPNQYLERFVDAYIPVGVEADVFINYLKERYQELKKVSLHNESFRAYLSSDAAKALVAPYAKYLKDFKANGNYSIVNSDQHESLTTNVSQMYEHLLSSLMINEENQTDRTDDSSSLALEKLNKITIDFASQSTKAAMLVYRTSLLRQIDKCVQSVHRPVEPQQLEQYNHLMDKVKEKKEQVGLIFTQLLYRFNVLEQIHFGVHTHLLDFGLQ